MAVQQVEVRGLSFDVRLDGAPDGPAVLLLHGFPQHGGMWWGVVPALRRAGLRTIAPDQRGYSPGARPAEPAAYKMAECVADALAILDALDVPAAHVVGHDWGAVVGWHLAGRHPDRVRTLTAVSVPHPAAHGHAIRHNPEQAARSAYILLFRHVRKAERVLLGSDARRLRALFAGVDPARAEEYVRPMLQPGALVAALRWYQALSRKDLDGLGPSAVPTTYLWSDGDVAVARAAARACADYVTGDYRFIELPGITHWIPDQAPEAVAEAVLARIAGG
jgi:pimeloyl-ACP methyl ester carboxylesterase